MSSESSYLLPKKIYRQKTKKKITSIGKNNFLTFCPFLARSRLRRKLMCRVKGAPRCGESEYAITVSVVLPEKKIHAKKNPKKSFFGGGE
jgi:hypothetical protein